MALVALSLPPRPARAWYFPEHTQLTQDGLLHLPPEVLARLAELTRDFGQGLCTAPLEALTDPGLRCVPYGTLPALAGDHSNTPGELLALLEGVGLRVVRAAGAQLREAGAIRQDELRRGDSELVRLDTDRRRNQSVRELDLKLIALDPGYMSRAGNSCAHFVMAEATLREQLAAVGRGDTNHALAQVVAHHVASLVAARAALRAPPSVAGDLLRHALLEHAFALHFLEDAFAAGHLVVGRDLCADGQSSARKQKHDYYCRFGAAVTRALAFGSCVGRGRTAEDRERCWVAQGDGYLPLDAEEAQRRNAAAAVARVQALFLVAATDPKRVRAWPRDVRRQLGFLLDPAPWYTLDPGRVSAWRNADARVATDSGRHAFEAERQLAIVEGALVALDALERLPAPACDVSSGPPRKGTCSPLPTALLAPPEVPCTAACFSLPPGVVPDPASARVCPTNDQLLPLGDPAVSLLRPVLATFPATQAPWSTLTAGSSFAHGMAYQVFVLGSGGARLGPDPVLPFLAGVGAGVSYRAEGALPGTDNRAAAELNLGFAQGTVVPSAGGISPETWRYRGDLFAELRVPLLSDLLALGYLKVGSWLGSDLSWASVALSRVRVLSGVRVWWAVNEDPRYRGFDLEVLGFQRQDPDMEFRTSTFVAPTEVRVRLGWIRDPLDAGRVHPTVTLEAAGGFSRFF